MTELPECMCVVYYKEGVWFGGQQREFPENKRTDPASCWQPNREGEFISLSANWKTNEYYNKMIPFPPFWTCQTCVCGVQSPFDLDASLGLFRQESVGRDVEIHIQVRRREPLRSALKAVRKPGFCFRATPIISFSEEETDGHEGPLREFFRLWLFTSCFTVQNPKYW